MPRRTRSEKTEAWTMLACPLPKDAGMKRISVLASSVVVALAASGLIGLAQPALAATSVTLTSGGTLEIGGAPAANGSNVNDTTINFTNNYANDVRFNTSTLVNGGTSALCNSGPTACVATASGGTLTLTAPGAATANMQQSSGGSWLPLAVFFTVNSGGGGGGGGSSTPAASASSDGIPSAVMQQVGLPAGGCEAVTATELNIGGAGSGGWGQSWAQWVNDGEGGAVCTRTLVYSPTLGSWTVG